MLTLPLDGANYWVVVNGPSERGEDFGYLSPQSHEPRYPYYVFCLFARHFGSTLLEAKTDDPRLRVYASTDGAETPTIFVMAINTSPTESIPAEVRLDSGQPSSIMSAVLLDADRIMVPVDTDGETGIVLPPYSVTAITVSPS